ncbi:MAG: ribosome maturation factor RimM [Bacteriovoracaceae bacterium]
MKDKLVSMGHAERTHGIKGGFTLELYNHEESFLKTKPTVWLFPRTHVHKTSTLPKQGIKFQIQNITLGHKVILYLENINNMDSAEAILPFDLKIEEHLLPAVDEDEIYLKDIFGLKAIDLDGNFVGEVMEAYDNGYQMILTLKKESGEKVDIPYVDHFIHEVNIEEGKIIVTLPDWNFS